MISSAPSKRFTAIFNFPSKIIYETQKKKRKEKKILASNSLGVASTDKGRPPVLWGRLFRLFIACPGSTDISTRPGNRSIS
jgi:hypothetical protein